MAEPYYNVCVLRGMHKFRHLHLRQRLRKGRADAHIPHNGAVRYMPAGMASVDGLCGAHSVVSGVLPPYQRHDRPEHSGQIHRYSGLLHRQDRSRRRHKDQRLHNVAVHAYVLHSQLQQDPFPG